MQTKRNLARFLLLLLSAVTLFSCIPANAEEVTLPSVDEATAVYFYHMESGSLICSKNTDTQISAGSAVKVLAGLIACEQLESRLQESISVTSDMVANSSGYRLKLEAGDVLTVEQLLYAAICGSYNDAYDVLSFVLADSKSEFAEQMNTRARELGAKSTTCTDPSGIDDSSFTTVSDMAKIALAAYQNELYMKISSTARYAISETSDLAVNTIANRNALIYSGTTTQYYNAKCRGMSAGYTERGGSCVITTATNGKESYLCIVMGAIDTDETNYGYEIANRLIDWVYKTYTYMEVITAETVICKLPVTVSDLTTEVEVKTDTSLSCYLPAGLEIGKEITYSIRLMYTSLEAPVTEGTLVGYVAVLWEGKTLGTVPLYTAGAAERSGFISGLKNIQALTQSRVFCAGAIFFILGLIAWITTEYVIIVRKRHKWDKYFSQKMSPSPISLTKKKRK